AALADSLTEDERKSHLLYPRIERIREVSAIVAAAVCRISGEIGTPAWNELIHHVE
ncbi:hypothetical protein K7432_017586, partial [Basidiobolus ranarum]